MSRVNQIELPKTDLDLTNLLRYLIQRKVISADFSTLFTQYSEQQDKFNAKSTRAFCHVTPAGPWSIFCSRWIEALPGKNRTALLLHEISHLAIFGFKNLESEVDVDEWVIAHVPEAKYRYENVGYIGAGGLYRVATNLQTVSEEFYGRLGETGSLG